MVLFGALDAGNVTTGAVVAPAHAYDWYKPARRLSTMIPDDKARVKPTPN
jgi:hypothetical protein